MVCSKSAVRSLFGASADVFAYKYCMGCKGATLLKLKNETLGEANCRPRTIQQLIDYATSPAAATKTGTPSLGAGSTAGLLVFDKVFAEHCCTAVPDSATNR